ITSREPAALDMDRVLERAAELGVAMEINSQPDRIDLKDSHARLAKEKGVRLVIDTDAHSAVQLANIRFGVFAARRAGLTKDDVLNTLPFERFQQALRRPGRAPAGAAKRAAAGAKPPTTARAAARRKTAKTGRGTATRRTATPSRAASKPRSRSRAAAKPARGKKR
ncbi:MAG: hypothetical protein AAB113_08025, partial [Candidatus Eisenbacteria bacterium]